MKKLLLLLSLMFISLTVRAEFTYFGVNAKGDEYYIDKSSIKKQGLIITTWIGQRFINPIGNIYSTKSQNQYDCYNEQSKILYVVTYSDKESKNIVSNGNPNDVWTPLLPGSIEHNLLKTICR